MRAYFRIIHSEFYKLMHSAVALIHLLVPILGMAVFLAYYRILPWTESEKISSYLQIVAVVFPVLLAVIMTIIRDSERMTGSFQEILCVPCQKSMIHVTKLLLMVFCGFLATFVAVFGFGIFFKWMGNDSFSSSFYVKAAVLLFSGYIPLYLLQYMISLTFPKGMGLGFGIFGSLLSALLMTGLGDAVWCYLPWSVSARMCSVYVECNIKNWSFVEWTGAGSGLKFILIAGTLLFLLFIAWGKGWEAPACEAE